MPQIGKFNILRILKTVDFGLYLDGKELGEILLPRRYVPEGCGVGDRLKVFLYHDSEDRLIATTQQPLAQVGELVLLKAVAVDKFGAFLDWGLPKDLLVPFSEQRQRMQVGKFYPVYVFLDVVTQRIAASSRLDKFTSYQTPPFVKGQPVSLVISDETEMGYKAIIDKRALGVLYHNETFQKLRQGQHIGGFIKNVRSDGKIDLMLEKPGYEKVTALSEKILAALQAGGGFLKVGDQTPAEQIQAMFGTSKKNFKKAVGALYKARRILLEADGIAIARTPVKEKTDKR